MKTKNRLYFDLVLIAVIHLVGIIGIYFLESIFFLRTSSVSILIPLFLFCYRSNLTNKDALLFASVFVIGYTAEFLGVNYQILFGDVGIIVSCKKSDFPQFLSNFRPKSAILDLRFSQF